MKRLLRSEEGFTLIELVTSSALAIVVLLSALTLLDGVTRSERGAQARYDVVLNVRGVMMQTTKLARQALTVDSTSTKSHLVMTTLVSGSPHHITFDVTGGSLIETDDTTGTGAQTILRRVTTPQPFCFDPPACTSTSPTSSKTLRITLAATSDKQSGGTVPVTLSSDVRLRNL